ncbi:hypothetical protein C1I95_30470 [Micromonospora craterilacus]|uniref:Tyr recombinase domain-containing protein n=1 Tax=Micromonospora craterilacus TaxID=1655439 RepID=A0A2W2EEU7_9ACTN|nr:tyrosine-type recombinase/integrase [Micromonospora craterilacus]PZG07927.1 hypothetical protein C1I95_30470 [Micromonospora craterilacus]
MFTVTATRAPHSHDLITAYQRHLQVLSRAEATVNTYAEELCILDRTLPEGLAYACGDELRDAIHVDGRKPAYKAKLTAIVGGFYAWASDPGNPRLDYNPAAHLSRVKVPARSPRPISNEELADILRRAREPMRTWYLLAAASGMRCCEIADLDRADVTAEQTWIHGKGDKERVVPTHPDVWAAVQQMPAGPIARTRAGRPANRIQVQERANYHLQATLGHAAVSMHRLRHWYGTHVYQSAGRDLRVAQELLGHSTPQTTQVYVAATAAAKSAAVSSLQLPT